jgi:1-acyl-sn-glycerol-3-phosphate acyltransferase
VSGMACLARALRTPYEYAVLYGGLLLLAVAGVVWSLLAWPLHLLLPRDAGRRVGRRAIQWLFRAYLRVLEATGTCRFEIDALDALADGEAMIVAPNHPCLLDAVIVLSRLPRAVCIMKSSLMANPVFGGGARLARYIRNEPLLGMAVQSVAELRRGAQLLVFPEGTRTTDWPLNSFKGSFAVAAGRARVPVQTVFIETASPFLCKGWPLWRKPAMPLHYRLRLGRRFIPGGDVAAFLRELEAYYRQELAQATLPLCRSEAGCRPTTGAAGR